MNTKRSWKPVSSFAGAILLGLLATAPAHAQSFDTLLQAQSPLDWWRFDETTVSPAINTVSNQGSAGAAGTGYVVKAVTGVAGGVAGNCVLFTNASQTVGACYSRIDIPNSPLLNPNPPFTVEFWAKPNSPFAPINDESPPTGLCPVSSLSIVGSTSFEGARSGYIFYASPVGWEFRLGGLQSYTATAAASTAPSTTSFTHVVGEFDGTTASIYINGVLAGTGPATGGPFHPNDFMPTRLGGTSLPGGEYEDANTAVLFGSGNRGWDGWVSEFAVYNTLLTSNTIAAHYSAGTNHSSSYDALILASTPVGYWNLEEGAYTQPSPSFTMAADGGSLGDAGTNTLGTLADQPGVPGTGDNSVFYSGSEGSLVLDTISTNLYDVADQTLTLAAWIKPVSFGYVSDIIAQGYDESTYVENFLRVGDSYDWAYFQDDNSGGNYNTNVVPDVKFYEVGAYDGGAGYVTAVFPAPPGDIGHWVFLVGTYDGENWNLYRNGNLVAQFGGAFPDGSGSGPAAVNLPWSVGSRSNPDPYFGMFFAGSISEPVIISNALDPLTISNLYNSVALPPVITQAPVAPTSAYLGSSASFSVWADGPGALTYQWYSNNVAISGQTGTNYSLTGLTAGNNATYSVIVTNNYGSVTSSVVLAVTGTLPPAVLVPASETRWLGSPLSFAPASLPNQQLSFQWELNGHAIGGATQSSYTAPAISGTAGSYTLVITNAFGAATSSVATLSLLTSPNSYVSTILGDGPLSYFRLDESNGTVAYDYAGGNNGEYYGAITHGVPGYSAADTDTAAYFPGLAQDYVGGIGPTAINFNGPSAEFSVEAWANGPAEQNTSYTGAAIISKGHAGNGATANEQFALTVETGAFGNVYTFFVRDSKGNAATAQAQAGPDGFWHHLVGVCDELGLGASGPSVTLYIDGAVAATGATSGLISSGITDSEDAVSIGAESSGPGPTFDLAYNGTISQVAIYPTNLSAAQVAAHYTAAYGSNLPPSITIEPVSTTNYITLPVTLNVHALGSVPLMYQWSKSGSGPISGATSNSLTISSVATTDAGTYSVAIVNSTGTTNSVPVTITVLQPPTNPPVIGGLVMHLTFDNTLVDATGRGNNGTNAVSGTTTVSTNVYVPGIIGQAYSYQTSTNSTSTNANYVSLGVRPDLQFGSNSFTVSMWVQLPANYIGNDLPFFTDAVGSTFGQGYLFAPSFASPTANWPGGWAFSVFDPAGNGEGVYGEIGSINDGGWHNLIFIMDHSAGATVFLDGTVAIQHRQSGTSITTAANINNTNSATIGQDPTGVYPQPGSAYIDDLGVWSRALTPLEAASIYMAGIVNSLSFTGPQAGATLQFQLLSNSQLQLSWTSGTLQSATSVTGPWSAVPNANSPFTVTINPTSAHQFYRLQL